MSLRLSTLSTEYIRVPVAGTTDGGASIDPTPLGVEVAVIRVGSAPGDTDWREAHWVTTTSGSATTYWARLLVGPTVPFTLTPGGYWVWVKIYDTAETPVKRSGLLVSF